MNQFEILLDILDYVHGNMFEDGTVTGLGTYGYDEAYVQMKLRNGDNLKIRVEYTKSEVKKDGK